MSRSGGLLFGQVDLAAIAVKVPVLRPLPRRKHWVPTPAVNAVGAEAEAESAAPEEAPLAPGDDLGLSALLTPQEAKLSAATDAHNSAAAAAAEAALADDEDDEPQTSAGVTDAPSDVAAEAVAVEGENVAGAAKADASGDAAKAFAGADSDEAAGAPAARAEAKEDDTSKEASKFLAEAAAGTGVCRQHIFITGPPGVGKTTLVQRLLYMLKEEEGEGVEINGFYTSEVRDKTGQRAGFDIVRVGSGAIGNDARDRFPIARIGQAQPKVGKYTIDVPGFEAFALPVLQPPPRAPPLPENARLYKRAGQEEEEVVRLLQENEAPPPSAKTGAAAREPFIAAAEWLGQMRGYYFGRGESGQGYYLDKAQELPEDGEEEKEDQTEQNMDWCSIFLPSEKTEVKVHSSTLRVPPEGWKDPRQEDDADQRLHPRLVVCDEVGKMELMSIRFPPTLREALEDDRGVFLGTLPQPPKGHKDHAVVDEIKRRADVKMFRVSRNNRDDLATEAYAALRRCLLLGPPGTGKPRARRLTRKEREAEQRAKEKEAKAKADEEAKRNAEIKAKRKQAAKRAERKARMEREDQLRKKVAEKVREERKKRAEIKKRAQEASKSGPMEVDEEEDLEVREEVELEPEDSDVELQNDLVAGVESDDSSVEVGLEEVDLDKMKLPPKSPALPKSPAPAVAVVVAHGSSTKRKLDAPAGAGKAKANRNGKNGVGAGAAVLLEDEDEVL